MLQIILGFGNPGRHSLEWGSYPCVACCIDPVHRSLQFQSFEWLLDFLTRKPLHPAFLQAKRNTVCTRIYCCTFSSRQGHADGLITGTKWEIPCKLLCYSAVTELVLQAGEMCSTTQPEGHSGHHRPGHSPVNWHVDQQLLELQSFSSQDHCTCLTTLSEHSCRISTFLPNLCTKLLLKEKIVWSSGWWNLVTF